MKILTFILLTCLTSQVAAEQSSAQPAAESSLSTSLKQQWGELTEFSKDAYHTSKEAIHDHFHPNPPDPILPERRDLEKSCEELYYELTGLDAYSTESGPQLLSNPYDFITDPINRAALIGASYYGENLYYILPVNGYLADKQSRIVDALKYRQEMLRTLLARQRCYQW